MAIAPLLVAPAQAAANLRKKKPGQGSGGSVTGPPSILGSILRTDDRVDGGTVTTPAPLPMEGAEGAASAAPAKRPTRIKRRTRPIGTPAPAYL